MKNFLVLTFLLFFSSFPIIGQIIHVPADYPTIQAGIDVAQNGDTVLVADSTYVENINFLGKAITVASNFIMDGDTNHINSTIIDGSQPSHPDSGSVVYFESGEDTTSILCGFTITGGTGTIVIPNLIRGGGGIACGFSGATICHNKIINNVVNYDFDAMGGGIATGPPGTGVFVIIENNVIQSNQTIGANFESYASYGAGIVTQTNCRVSGNLIVDNVSSSELREAWSGGFASLGSDYVLFTNNKVVGNKALTNSTTTLGAGGGIYFLRDSSAYIRVMNNIIANNEVKSEYVTRGAGMGFESTGNYGGDVLFANNIVYGNYSSGSGVSRGGGISLYKSTVKVINNTITTNSSDYGGGLYSYDSESSVIMNSIFWGDISNSEVYIRGTAPAPEIVYSDIQGGWGDTTNINSDPFFMDPSIYDFYLQDTSPCIGAAIDSMEIAGTWYYCPLTDIEDSTRPNPSGSMPDMGTYEHWLDHPIPVELTSFTASTGFGKVTLSWTTATEINNLGFEIERKIINNAEGEWVRIGFKEGYGTTTEPKEYSFIDDISDVNATSMAYRLKQIDFDGSYEYSEEVLVETLAPVNFVLEQNYPNPFNPATTISFGIPVKSIVVLKVFNSIGEEVAKLINEEKAAGTYSLEFDATNFPSGVYFYQLRAGSFIETKKMLMIK